MSGTDLGIPSGVKKRAPEDLDPASRGNAPTKNPYGLNSPKGCLHNFPVKRNFHTASNFHTPNLRGYCWYLDNNDKSPQRDQVISTNQSPRFEKNFNPRPDNLERSPSAFLNLSREFLSSS